MTRRFNWPLWSGLLVTLAGLLSYFLFFVQFEATRDLPWPSFALLALAALLLIAGWRRAARKILPSMVVLLCLAGASAFTFLVTVGTKGLPTSARAPAVGEQAPDFTLPDTNNRPVSLSRLLADSNGVLLVFYRGYW